MNMLAALYDFLEHKTPTPTQDAVYVSAKCKRQWDMLRAFNRAMKELPGEVVPENPEPDPVWFGKLGGFFLILDESAEDDSFTLTSCLDQV